MCYSGEIPQRVCCTPEYSLCPWLKVCMPGECVLLFWVIAKNPLKDEKHSTLLALDLSTLGHDHSALGHPSKLSEQPYQDENLIPKIHSDFGCTTCVQTRSAHPVPPPHTQHSQRAFKIIHSDLSGISSVLSYGNSRYYITFIDDYTRMAWVYFLK